MTRKLVIYNDTVHDFEAVDPQNASVVAIPTFRIVTATPAAGTTMGEAIINSTTNQAFVWDGNHWQDITPSAITKVDTEAHLLANPPTDPTGSYAMAADTGHLFMGTAGGQWVPVSPKSYPLQTALLTDTPPDGTIGYAQDSSAVFYRLAGNWVGSSFISDTRANILALGSVQGQVAVPTDSASIFKADAAGGWDELPFKTFATEVALLASTPSDGTIAIAADTRSLYTRSGGAWFRVGGGVTVGTAAPATAANGDLYWGPLTTAAGSPARLWVRSGGNWLPVNRNFYVGAGVGAADNQIDDLYWDTGSHELSVKLAADWTPVRPAIAHGTALPATGVDGELFLKTDTNALYVYQGGWHKAGGRGSRTVIARDVRHVTDGYGTEVRLDTYDRIEYSLVTRGQTFNVGSPTGTGGISWKGSAFYAGNTTSQVSSIPVGKGQTKLFSQRGTQQVTGFLVPFPDGSWQGLMQGTLTEQGANVVATASGGGWWNFMVAVVVEAGHNMGFGSLQGEVGHLNFVAWGIMER